MNETLLSFLPLILIFVVFYFLLIRPQQKKIKEHKDMIGKIKKGDKVLTAGGIYCKVSKVIDDNKLEVEITNGVNVIISRPTVTDVINSNTTSNKE